MAELIEVAPSGTIGKQVFATDKQAVLCGALLTAGVSAATLVIKDGNASGTTVLTLKAGINTSTPNIEVEKRFDKGMHVKVTPASALAYLQIE